MGRTLLVLMSLSAVCGLSACGQPKDVFDCRLKIELSGGLDGTFKYGNRYYSKSCSGAGTGDEFNIGMSRDELPYMSIYVCGVGPGETGDGLANLSISHEGDSWESGDGWYDCEQGACPVTITKNAFQREESDGFPGAEYWVEGSGHCDQPLVGWDGSGLEPIEVVGEFTFGGMPGMWE